MSTNAQTPTVSPAPVPSAAAAAAEHGALVRSLSATLPKPLGLLLATLAVLAALAFGTWSLIATWSGQPDSALPLFQVAVAGAVVSANAIYARRTFSYVLTLIGAVLWIWVSITPFLPLWQTVLQAATVTLMAVGAVCSVAAVALSSKPRF